MSFADERRAIEERFEANWTDTPIKYENADFEQPQTAFVAITIRPGTGRKIAINLDRHRYLGLIIVDVFVPEDTGTQAAKVHADGVAEIFREASFSVGSSGNIVCRTPQLTSVGVRNGWHQESVSIPYKRDRTF